MCSAERRTVSSNPRLAAGRPLTLDQLLAMFDDTEKPERADLREAINALQEDYAERGIDLVQVGGGYRIQVRQSMQPWVARLWEEKPARYSRALLETLALIAYRQPITRGEIESVRGVAVSTNIIKTLLLGAPSDPSQAYSAHVVMPSFGTVLNDAQIATLASFIRASWGNDAAPVTAKQVGELRSAP